MLQVPFEFTGWDPADTFVFIFYKVRFTQDFGSLLKGSFYHSIDVDLTEGTIKAYDEDGQTVLLEQKFRMSPTI